MAVAQRTFDTLIEDMIRVVERFPLPALAAAGITVYHLFELHTLWPDDRDAALRLWGGIAGFFLVSLAAVLVAEARQWSSMRMIAVAATGGLTLALLLWLGPTADVMVPPLLLGLTLLLAVAAYSGRSADQAAFWMFNHQFWIVSALALVGAVVFAGGVSAIIETLRYLFGIDPGSKAHYRVWSVGLGFIAPMMWLALVPERFDVQVAEGRQVEFTSSAVAILVTYILAPLLFVYAAILHIYAVKILVELELPKGRLGWLVLTYGCFVTATALLAYPSRLASGPHVRLFWQYWPLLLAVPCILLFVAIGVRIGAYGMTPDRYLVVLAGVWLAGLVIVQGLGFWGRDLRVIPASLAALLLAAAFGPWGMSGLSVWWQKAVFIAGLEQANVAKAGKVVVDGKKPADLGEAKSRVHSALDFLREYDRLDVLRPLFAGQPGNPFSKQRTPAYTLANLIKDRLGLDKSFVAGRSARAHQSFGVKSPYILTAAARGRFYGPVHAYQSGEPRAGEMDGQKIGARLQSNVLEVSIGAEPSFRFDLLGEPVLRGALSVQGTSVFGHPGLIKFTARRSSGHLDILVVGAQAYSSGGSDDFQIRSVEFWVVVPEKQ